LHTQEEEEVTSRQDKLYKLTKDGRELTFYQITDFNILHQTPTELVFLPDQVFHLHLRISS